jgi:hypothetical protein
MGKTRNNKKKHNKTNKKKHRGGNDQAILQQNQQQDTNEVKDSEEKKPTFTEKMKSSWNEMCSYTSYSKKQCKNPKTNTDCTFWDYFGYGLWSPNCKKVPQVTTLL